MLVAQYLAERGCLLEFSISLLEALELVLIMMIRVPAGDDKTRTQFPYTAAYRRLFYFCECEANGICPCTVIRVL